MSACDISIEVVSTIGLGVFIIVVFVTPVFNSTRWIDLCIRSV